MVTSQTPFSPLVRFVVCPTPGMSPAASRIAWAFGA
jgi:hypothetical protein